MTSAVAAGPMFFAWSPIVGDAFAMVFSGGFVLSILRVYEETATRGVFDQFRLSRSSYGSSYSWCQHSKSASHRTWYMERRSSCEIYEQRWRLQVHGSKIPQHSSFLQYVHLICQTFVENQRRWFSARQKVYPGRRRKSKRCCFTLYRVTCLRGRRFKYGFELQRLP